MDHRLASPDGRFVNCRRLPAWLAAGPAVALALAGPVQAQERELGMSVIGNRELPKSLVIVPWKSPTLTERNDGGLQSLISRSLQPLDPSELRRRLRHAAVAEAGASAPP